MVKFFKLNLRDRSDFFFILFIFIFFIFKCLQLPEIMTHIDDIGPISHLLLHFEKNPLFAPLIIARKNWTYAPAQFLLTRLFLEFATTPKEILFWSRMPSLLFWIMGIILFYRTYCILFTPKSKLAAICATFIIAFSLRGNIESSMSYTYAVTLPISVLIFYYFVYNKSPYYNSYSLFKLLSHGFLLGLLVSFSYQAIFLLLAGFALLGIKFINNFNYHNLKKIFALALGILIPFTLVYLFSLKYMSSHGTPAWAEGVYKSGPFLSYILKQWYGVFVSLTQTSTNNTIRLVYSIFMILFTSFLFIKRFLIKLKISTLEVNLLLFSFSIFSIWTIASYLNIFPLSVTRHTLVIQAPIIFLISYLFIFIKSRAILILIALTIPTSFLLQYSNYYNSIKNNVDTELIFKYLVHPSTLIGSLDGDTIDYFLLIKKYPELSNKIIHNNPVEEIIKTRPNHFALISHRSPISTDATSIFKKLNYKHTNIRAISPLGSLDLDRIRNGGNGFFMDLFDLNPEMQQ